jgi:3-deoxy-manno-octulosonate cytidylyltransferase (CMP-KDO synthetase)
MKILGIIPARFASTRFPEKALVDIGGKSMVQRVYEQASLSKRLSGVIVATDHPKIADHVAGFGGRVAITSENHQSGTDRCMEVISHEKNTYDFVVNIQGDEPFIQPEQIDLLIDSLESTTQLATLAKKITDTETLFNPNTPKIIWNEQQEAIYFSRQTIPFLRNVPSQEWLAQHAFYKHIGIYAYRTDILAQITQLPVSSLEKAEALEQLRWLENGFKIKVALTEYETIGIDTPEDLKKIAHLL